MSGPQRRSGPGRGWLAAGMACEAVVLGVIHLAAWRSGWRLVADNAAVVLRAGDVATRHPPLVGMPSGFSAWSDVADPFHPGPAVFWSLSPTGVLGSHEGLVLALTWAVGVVSAAIVVRVTERVAGTWMAIAALLATVFFQISVHDTPIWSPLTLAVATQPLFALCFVTWAVLAGHGRYLALWVALASFVAQADLTFTTTVAALGVVVAASLVRAARRRDGSGPRPRDLGLAVAVAVLLWAPPVVDAIANDGGNLAELLRAGGADVPVLGVERSLVALALVLSHLLSGDALTMDPLRWAVLLAAVAVAALPGVRRAARSSMPLVASAAAATFGAVAAQGLTPVAAGIEPAYVLPVVVVTGYAWFAIGVVAWRALEGRAGAAARSPHVRRARFAAPVGSLLVVGLLVAGLQSDDPYLQERSGAIDPVVAAMDASLPDGSYRWHPLGGEDATAFGHGVVLRMLDHGLVPHVEAGLAKYYGPQRRIDGAERGDLYLTFSSRRPPVAGARAIATWHHPDRDEATVARTERDVAAAVRDLPIRFQSSVASYVGTIVAAFDPDAAGTSERDDAGLTALGARYLADPDRVRSLSDAAVTELVVQSLLQAPPMPDPLQRGLEERRRTPEVQVWYRSADET